MRSPTTRHCCAALLLSLALGIALADLAAASDVKVGDVQAFGQAFTNPDVTSIGVLNVSSDSRSARARACVLRLVVGRDHATSRTQPPRSRCAQDLSAEGFASQLASSTSGGSNPYTLQVRALGAAALGRGRARVRVQFSTWLPSLAGHSRPHAQRDLLIYSAASSGRPTLDLAYLTGLVKLAPGRTFTIQGVRARRMEAGIPMGLFVYSPGATVVLDDVADSADVSVALAPFAVASHPPSCHPDTPVLSCLHLCAHRCVRRRALPRSSSPALCRGPSPAPTRAPFPPAAPTK